jgi:hypothetical protein
MVTGLGRHCGELYDELRLDLSMPSEMGGDEERNRISCCRKVIQVSFAELKWPLVVCYRDAGRYWI